MTAQFSIYKITCDAVKSPTATNNVPQNITSVIDTLVNHVLSMIKSRQSSRFDRVEHSGFSGVIFKTIHKPTWEGIANTILSNNQYTGNQAKTSIDCLENTNVSYVLFYPYKNDVYAVTGGYGSHYINRYIEKNFGLYLIPKLVNNNDSVVKSTIQNNLLGNQTATQKTNKLSTSISVERDTSSIFRQLNIEVDRDVAEEMGITFDANESLSKKTNIANKDSLVIHRSMSLTDLKTLIENLWQFENTRVDNFALNYLVPAKKKRIQNTELFNRLIETLQDGKFDQFLLTGDDYTTFYIGADHYELYDDKGNILINQDAPITFDNIIKCVPITKQRHSKIALETMLKKWSISTFDNANNCILYKLSVFDAIQGFVEYGAKKIHCYLFNGLWYVFEERFTASLNNDFMAFFDQKITDVNNIATMFGLRQAAANEDAYNLGLRNNPQIVVAHTVLVNNVEVADAIFGDNQNLYLMHNKGKFDGAGSRDVNNQIVTAAEYLSQMLAYGANEDFLGQYYDAISAKYTQAQLTLAINKNDFINAFRSGKKITYIAGYIKNYRRNSRATYAKYLTLETTKKLATKGFSYIIIGTTP